MNMSCPPPSLSLFHTLPYTHVPVPVLEIYYILTASRRALLGPVGAMRAPSSVVSGQPVQARVVGGDGAFADADNGVGGVGGVGGRQCDGRSGSSDVGQCGVGVGGAVELVEGPLGFCEQRCQ
jgi:hypothetical protein